MKKIQLLIITITFTLLILPNVLSPYQAKCEELLLDVLTCEEYDTETYEPLGITNFFEVQSPGALFWFNTTYIQDTEISILWYPQEGDIYYEDNWTMNYEENTNSWYVDSSYLQIYDQEPAEYQGTWYINLYLDDIYQASHNFTIYDIDEWGYYAEIIEVNTPTDSINPNEEYLVEIKISYQFDTNTVLTPGLWDPEEYDLIAEEIDEVEGSGTSTYKLYPMAPNEIGTYSIDAAAFYLVEDEWFIDDAGLVGFEITVGINTENEGIQWDQIIPIVLCFIAALALVLYQRRRN